MDYTNLLINILSTALLYEIIPILLKFILEKKYTEKQAQKIAIINSIGVFIIFTFLHIYLDDGVNMARVGPAFFWGYIAFGILKNNKLYEEDEKISISMKLNSNQDLLVQKRPDEEHKYCTNCGKIISITDNYCANCGHFTKNTIYK